MLNVNLSVNVKAAKNKIKLKSKAVQQKIDKALIDSVALLQAEMKKSINERSYGRRYDRGAKVHIASAPGDAPNTDSGRLINSILTSYSRASRSAKVYISKFADYAVYLEFGTKNGKLKKRPFFYPAIRKHRSTIRSRLRGVLR